MKGFISGGLSALLLTTATAAMAEPTTRIQAQKPVETSMVFNFTAPMITNSGVLNSTHFIRLAVIGMSLEEIMISIPSQMERFEAVQVLDQTGKKVPAKIDVRKEQLAIAFDSPVAAGTYLQVEFTGVQMRTLNDGILLFGVTGRSTGRKVAIPIGTARIQLPVRG